MTTHENGDQTMCGFCYPEDAPVVRGYYNREEPSPRGAEVSDPATVLRQDDLCVHGHSADDAHVCGTAR